MRFLLINPGRMDDNGQHIKMAKAYCYSFNLPYIAGFIPDHHQIKIVDDVVEYIDFDADVDVVMLTGMTSQADRAYQIAREFKSRGKKVVMGGIHASLLPEEALEYVDSVVVGEAENLMEELIDDLESNSLKQIYKSESKPDLRGLPTPRYDLINRNNYIFTFDVVHAIRGCPYRCRYCIVTKMMGAKYRKRPIGDVLRDLSHIGSYTGFTDDNFFCDRDYSLELVKAMKGMGKLWGTQANLDIAFDDELLRAAKDAGLTSLAVGIESLDSGILQTMKKNMNVDLDVGEAIDRILSHGIYLQGSMIVGFDKDTEQSLNEMIDFLIKHKLPTLYLFILTPTPGTDLWNDMEDTGRLIPNPWYKFNFLHATFHHKSMSPEQLESLFWRLQARFYSTSGILKRLTFPFKPHPMIINFLNQRKLKYRFHPLSGYPWKTPTLEAILSRIAKSKSQDQKDNYSNSDNVTARIEESCS